MNACCHVFSNEIKKRFHFADAGLSDNTSPTHFQAIANAQQLQQFEQHEQQIKQQQQNRCIIHANTKKSSPKALPTTYCTSTRSAAVMALALRSQTPPSPQSTHKNSRSYQRSSETASHSAESTFTTTTAATTATRSPVQQLKSKLINERPNGIGDLYSGGSSSSDNDGVNTSSSSSATALRRLYFKSGRSTKTKANNANKASMSMTQITKNAICTAAVLYHSSVEGALGSNSGNTPNGKSVPKVSIIFYSVFALNF